MKIYTKTGDSGETSFIGGRISKASDMIDLIGELDELNSALGMVVSDLAATEEDDYIDLTEHLYVMQSQIFQLGALVAQPAMAQAKIKSLQTKIDTWVADLEKLIDAWQSELKPLQNFILPGGKTWGAHLHHARSVTRRCERSCVRLIKGLSAQPDSQSSYPDNLALVQMYLNRLSDAFFMAARYVNHIHNEQERIWSGDSEQMRLF